MSSPLEDTFALTPIRRRGANGKPRKVRQSVVGRESHVYVIGADEGDFLKVGRAFDVAQRLTAMQTGSPWELRIIFWARMPKEMAVKVEALAHGLLGLAGFQQRGEWFDAPRARAVEAVWRAVRELGVEVSATAGDPTALSETATDIAVAMAEDRRRKQRRRID